MTIAALLVVVALTLAALGCGFFTPQPTRVPATPVPTAVPDAPIVELDIMNFRHTDTEVKANTVVIWTNRDTSLHTVTHIQEGGIENRLFDSSTLPKSDGFRYHFTEPGMYSYQCLVHPVNMKATITVTE